MNGLEFVDYRESLGVRLGEWLRNKGLDLASSTGDALGPLHAPLTGSIGVLLRDAPVKRFLGPRPRRTFLGTIWLDNDSRNATPGGRWVFDMYGRENVEFAKQLCEKMAREFDVPVSLRLLHENRWLESFPGDGAW